MRYNNICSAEYGGNSFGDVDCEYKNAPPTCRFGGCRRSMRCEFKKAEESQGLIIPRSILHEYEFNIKIFNIAVLA